MFDEVKTTRHITENYTDFVDETLVEKKPVANWPKLLGQQAADVINNERHGVVTKVLVVYGGIGRIALELLRGCTNLKIDQSDVTANKLQVLEYLLKESRIKWYQQVEGTICEGLDYHLEDSETPATLLGDRNNEVSYWQTDYKNIRSQLDNYDVIVADIRHKDSGDELQHIVSKLKIGGLLILGSIDDTSEGVQFSDKHSLAVLRSVFERVEGMDTKEYPHIYRETQNKHQYAISYLSAWKKLSDKTNKEARDFDVIPSSSDVTDATDYYEDNHILSSYHKFHFGDGLLSVKNFLLRIAEVAIEMCKKYRTNFGAALDAGCGPGRCAIELAKCFEKVEGYDYSHGFINMMREEVKKRNLSNVTSYQGDSHKQQETCQLKKFDVIVGCNLIDRLHSPEIWLQQSKAMLNKGGLLIVASPYTWKDEHTEPQKWLGGCKKDGEDMYTVDGLRARLAPELVLLEEVKVPFVIPDADGTYQYTYSNCTVFGSSTKQ